MALAPAIIMPVRDKWRRDKHVFEMIRALDQHDRVDRLDLLTRKEREAVVTEIHRCMESFEYAARNYFWIVDERNQDVPFFLWESQELILEKLRWLQSKGRRQKLYTLKARRLGCCLDPSTRVLTVDLKWVPIDQVPPGQELVAVDENVPGGRGAGRKMRRATVVARREVYEPAFRLRMDNGQSLVATGQHRFLCKKRSQTTTEWRAVHWKTPGRKGSSPIRVGDEIRYVTEPWAESTYEDGWFGGMLDGEGTVRRKSTGGLEALVSQTLGHVCDRASAYLRNRGYTFHVEMDYGRSRNDGCKRKPLAKLAVNRTNQVFRLIGQTRPIRFLNPSWWEGSDLPGKCSGEAWSKVIAIEPLPKQRMIDLQTDTGTFIAEGFVSHNSTLIEALIAHQAMFFPNRYGLVVSYDKSHSEYLFSIVLHIYDMMPWWLKPEWASRKYDEGLHFATRDPDARRLNPGLNSRIKVEYATKMSGVGQGVRITSAHMSEHSDWDPSDAKKVIEGDMVYALSNDPETFAVLETTGKGSGSYAHQLWRANVALADEAEWYPLFLPWFFERTRVMAPENGWKPPKPETRMCERVGRDWVRCDNPDCADYRESSFDDQSLVDALCPACQRGRLVPVVLTGEQLYFMYCQRINKEARGADMVKELKQELASTAEESWQLSGIQVFPQDCFEWVNACIDKYPPVVGNLDTKGNIHWVTDPVTGKCGQKWCLDDHRHDPEKPLRIWEWPEPGAEYTAGVDPAEGLGGKHEYSVIWFNKVSKPPEPDVHVATYRSNTVAAVDLAGVANALGRLYNNALMSVEYNNYTTVGDNLKMYYQYPNLFRWKHYDSVYRPESNKWHWVTNMKTRPALWQTAVKWLRAQMWVVRDPLFYAEMETFQKDEEDSRRAEHERGSFDDVIFGGCIALFTSHDMDWDPNLETITMPAGVQSSLVDAPEWEVTCQRCQYQWEAKEFQMRPVPGREMTRCPSCKSVLLSAHRIVAQVRGFPNPFKDYPDDESDEPKKPIAEYALL